MSESDMHGLHDELADVERAIELDPKNPTNWLSKASVLQRLKRYEESLAAMDEAIRLNPNDAEMWLLQGAFLWVGERYEESLAPIDEAIRLNPHDASNWSFKAGVLKDLKRYEESLAALDEALRLNPNDASGWFVRASVLRHLEKHDKALESINRAIELEPGNANHRSAQASILEDLNRSEEGTAAIDEGLKIYPQDAQLWEQKAMLLHDSQDIGAALLTIEKAIQLGLDTDTAHNTNGVILMRLGAYEEALRCFNLAIGKKRSDLYLYNKALALDHLKRPDEARICLVYAQTLASTEKTPQARKAAKKYNEYIQRLDRDPRGESWWEWWFRDEGQGRKVFGGFLISLLCLYLVVPLINSESSRSCQLLYILNCGKDWSFYVLPALVAALLLLSPAIKRLGLREIELAPPEVRRREPKVSDVMLRRKTRLD